jgi:hypothetical protein
MLERLRDMLNLRRPGDPAEDHPSVVVLLQEFQPLTQEQALQTAQQAWGSGAPVEAAGALENGTSFVFRSGKFFFALHQTGSRYEVKGLELGAVTQGPWDEHEGWFSVDLPTARTAALRKIQSLGSCYKMLLVYVFLRWSPNCLAVYFPAEGVAVPNLGDLAESIKWARRNGTNLDFLKDD